MDQCSIRSKQQACRFRTGCCSSLVANSCGKGWLSMSSRTPILAATMTHRHLHHAAQPAAACSSARLQELVHASCSHWPVVEARRARGGPAGSVRERVITARAAPRQHSSSGLSGPSMHADSSRFTPDYIDKLQQLQPMMTAQAIQHLREATPADQRPDLEQLLEDIQLLQSGWLHQYTSSQPHDHQRAMPISQELPPVFIRYLQQEVLVGLEAEQLDAALDLMGRDTLQVIARLYEELVELQQQPGDVQLLQAKFEELSSVMADIMCSLSEESEAAAEQAGVQEQEQWEEEQEELAVTGQQQVQQQQQQLAEPVGLQPAVPTKRTARKGASKVQEAARDVTPVGLQQPVVAVHAVAEPLLPPAITQHVQPEEAVGQEQHASELPGQHASELPGQQVGLQGAGSGRVPVGSGSSSIRGVGGSGGGSQGPVRPPQVHAPAAQPVVASHPLQHAAGGAQAAGVGGKTGASRAGVSKGGWLLKRPGGSAWAWADSPLSGSISNESYLGQHQAGLRKEEEEEQAEAAQAVQSRIKLIGKRTVGRRRMPREAPFSPTAVQARPNTSADVLEEGS